MKWNVYFKCFSEIVSFYWNGNKMTLSLMILFALPLIANVSETNKIALFFHSSTFNHPVFLILRCYLFKQHICEISKSSLKFFVFWLKSLVHLYLMCFNLYIPFCYFFLFVFILFLSVIFIPLLFFSVLIKYF